jgi:hypothetical protein
MSPSRLLPPDALLSSWLIVKSSHQLRCPPLFVAVADHLPPPDALLLRRRCLHCHAAANFIDAPPLPSSLHRRFCLLRRAAVTFIIAPLLIVAPPLPSSSRRRFCLRRRAAGSAEGMPVLMRTGEIGDVARQQYALNPDAQLGSSAGFVA